MSCLGLNGLFSAEEVGNVNWIALFIGGWITVLIVWSVIRFIQEANWSKAQIISSHNISR